MPQLLSENIFDNDENLEHDDEDPSTGSLHNNAFIFNKIVGGNDNLPKNYPPENYLHRNNPPHHF